MPALPLCSLLHPHRSKFCMLLDSFSISQVQSVTSKFHVSCSISSYCCSSRSYPPTPSSDSAQSVCNNTRPLRSIRCFRYKRQRLLFKSRPKLYRCLDLASYDWTNMRLTDTHNPIRGRIHILVIHVFLLFIGLPDHSKSVALPCSQLHAFFQILVNIPKITPDVLELLSDCFADDLFRCFLRFAKAR